MTKIKLGIDQIDDYLYVFKDQRVGLITNPTGVNSQLESTIDILNKKTHLTTLFSPEHGVRGDLQAGIKLDNYQDEETGCMVYSLYGKDRKPSEDMLKDVDVIAFDIQDVGARYYTYLYTMAYAMMAAKEQGKKMVIFDRPNPVGADKVEGNILDLSCRSFVGYYPITQRFGLTIGELALLFNKEYDIDCDLTVIPMANYKRTDTYNDTGLHWIFPSPNIPTTHTAYAYLITCYFEGTNMSEARGTAKPFEMFGAPWFKAKPLLDALGQYHLPGVWFRKTHFTPYYSKYNNELCEGIEIIIDDYDTLEPVKTGMTIIYLLKELYDQFEFLKPAYEGRHPMIDFLNGDTFLREHTMSLDDIYEKISNDSEQFRKLKGTYHLYD